MTEDQEIAATQELIRALSQISTILDFPPEIVIKLLKMPSKDMWKLSSLLATAERMEFTPEEMAQALDLAKVSRIMEEERAVAISPTGPIGPTGMGGFINLPSGPHLAGGFISMATGPKGATAAPPPKMHPKFTSSQDDPK